MSVLPEKAKNFFQNAKNLESFPVFALYVLCIVFIPLWKKLFSPFELKKIMILYNIVCVLLSILGTFLLWYGTLISGTLYAYVENSFIEKGLMVYTITKNVELLDTLFMILRHKWKQISFLHVFHHSTILVLGNYAWIYSPYPPVAIVIGLNSLVHVFLYAYYAKTALSSFVSPSWKKRLTQFQLAQFLFDFGFACNGYLYHGFCIYSLIYCLSMIFLFGNFYYHAYIKTKKIQKKAE